MIDHNEKTGHKLEVHMANYSDCVASVATNGKKEQVLSVSAGSHVTDNTNNNNNKKETTYRVDDEHKDITVHDVRPTA